MSQPSADVECRGESEDHDELDHANTTTMSVMDVLELDQLRQQLQGPDSDDSDDLLTDLDILENDTRPPLQAPEGVRSIKTDVADSSSLKTVEANSTTNSKRLFIDSQTKKNG